MGLSNGGSFNTIMSSTIICFELYLSNGASDIFSFVRTVQPDEKRYSTHYLLGPNINTYFCNNFLGRQ